MKLYATTTSERASKGQGGEWLRIDIQNEQKKTVSRLYINTLYRGKTGIHIDYNDSVFFTEHGYESEYIPMDEPRKQTKGKKKKSE